MPRLISVIIPTYNREAYIVDAVKSVLDQKVPSGYSLEVIVVDDGSTDNTKKALSPLMNNIRYKKFPNSGRPAVPRNLGIKMSKGSLIAFQDSDDKWAKNKLVNQLKTFEDDSIGLSHGGVSEMEIDGRVSHKPLVDNVGKNIDFESLVQSNFISTLTVIVRKKALEGVGYFDESLALRGVEDYELWLRVAARNKVSYTAKTLAYYRRHDQNISLSVDAEGESHLYKLFKLTRHKDVYSPSQKIALNEKMLSLLQVQKMSRLNFFIRNFSLRLSNRLLRQRV